MPAAFSRDDRHQLIKAGAPRRALGGDLPGDARTMQAACGRALSAMSTICVAAIRSSAALSARLSRATSSSRMWRGPRRCRDAVNPRPTASSVASTGSMRPPRCGWSRRSMLTPRRSASWTCSAFKHQDGIGVKFIVGMSAFNAVDASQRCSGGVMDNGAACSIPLPARRRRA